MWKLVALPSVAAMALMLATRVAAQAPLNVSALAVSQPQMICEIDLATLKGELRRLSWSPDAAYLHLQTVEDRTIAHDFILALEDRELSVAFGEPEWAAAYWARKSDLAAPGLPSLKLEITQANRRTRPMPFTGGCLRQDIRRNRWAFGRKDVPMEVALLGLLSPTSGQLL